METPSELAGWKIHNFDGILQERWEFSVLMLVYRRVSGVFGHSSPRKLRCYDPI